MLGRFILVTVLGSNTQCCIKWKGAVYYRPLNNSQVGLKISKKTIKNII